MQFESARLRPNRTAPLLVHWYNDAARRDQRQCCADPGVDGSNRDAGAEVLAIEIEVCLVIVDAGRVAAATTVFLSGSVGLAGRSVSGPPALAGVHDDAQQLAITW